MTTKSDIILRLLIATDRKYRIIENGEMYVKMSFDDWDLLLQTIIKLCDD